MTSNNPEPRVSNTWPVGCFWPHTLLLHIVQFGPLSNPLNWRRKQLMFPTQKLFLITLSQLRVAIKGTTFLTLAHWLLFSALQVTTWICFVSPINIYRTIKAS